MHLLVVFSSLQFDLWSHTSLYYLQGTSYKIPVSIKEIPTD